MINEHFQSLNENMKFEALSQLREIQSNLVGISFLPVIAIMKETNPLKKTVLQFQDDLDKLTIDIQDFISKAKNDVDFEEPEEEKEEPEEEEKEVEPEEEVKDTTKSKI